VAEAIPPPAAADREALRRSIEARGVQVPVLVLPDGRIIDGSNRWELSGGTAPVEVRDLPEAEALALAFSLNRDRRQLGPEQLAEFRRRHALALRAVGRSQEEAGREVGVDQSTVARWEKGGERLCEVHNGSPPPDLRLRVPRADWPKILARVEAGEPTAAVAADYRVSQRRVRKIAEAERAKAEAEGGRARRADEGRKVAGDLGVLEGDFREVARRLPDGSVSLVFTDPPYVRESLPLFGDLAEVAKRVLRPGGSLLCYCGHYALAEILPLMTRHLSFYWCCACVHSGPQALMRLFGVRVGWKPILWFTNGPRPVHETQDFVSDVVSGGREKDAHDWQQAEGEAAYYVGKLTRPGETVFDPFCGGGTTPAAALSLGRQIIACDIDPEKVAISRERVARAAPPPGTAPARPAGQGPAPGPGERPGRP
jgi:SAM-dependent methyltransferase